MNYKNILIILLTVLTTSVLCAQANILNAKIPEEIGYKTAEQLEADNDNPLPYGYVDDRDILWSKIVWEKIDLDERVNFPFYYPVDGSGDQTRKPLYDILVDNIKQGFIVDVYVDSYFTESRDFNDLSATLEKVDTTDLGYEQLNAGEQISDEFINRRTLTAADIEEYRIKGIWYFDKRQGELKYRLLGIAPAAPDVNFIDSEETDLVELFWIWFPTAREILHEAKSFNDDNPSRSISFDQLLNSRRFNAVIYKEENVQGDREIQDYIPDNAFFQLIEGERIKETIRNKELDMWSY